MKIQKAFLGSVVIALLLQAASMANAVQINDKKLLGHLPNISIQNPSPGVVSNFVCDSSTHTCSCKLDSTDCFDLGSSGLCKEGTIRPDDSQYQTLVCEFKY